MQALLILVAPALFAASIYIILGRIILLVDGERYSLVRQKWLTKVFVAGDVFSFLVQSGGKLWIESPTIDRKLILRCVTGGGIQAKGTLDAQKLGEKLILGGLFVQLLFFAFFVIVAGVFHHRLVNDRPLKNRSGPSSSVNKARKHRHVPSSSSATQVQASVSRTDIAVLPWKRHLYILYFTSALILVRSLFRVIEYIQGHSGYLLSHEVYLYVFDALLMLLVMVSFNWIHPSQVTGLYPERMRNNTAIELRRTRKERLARDEERLVGNNKDRVGVHTGGWTASRQS